MKTTKRIFSLMLCALLLLGAVCTTYAIDGGEAKPSIKPSNVEYEVTVAYKQSKTYEFEATDLPDDATVHVYCNGEDWGEGTYITVEKPTEDFTVEAKILDKDGQVIAASGEVKVMVQNTFADKLKDLFHNTFGRFFDGIGDIFGAIFMRIWIWLHKFY